MYKCKLFLMDNVITESFFNEMEGKDLLDYLFYYYRFYKADTLNQTDLMPLYEEIINRPRETQIIYDLILSIMGDEPRGSHCATMFSWFLQLFLVESPNDGEGALLETLDLPFIFWMAIQLLEENNYDFNTLDKKYGQLSLPFPEVASSSSSDC